MRGNALFKRALWWLYGRTGPWQALRLWLVMVTRHGFEVGRSRFRALPPGDMRPADEQLRKDQRFLLKRAERLGPVFKCSTRSRLLIAIVDNEKARRFIGASDGRLASRHKNLDALFPVGHLRAMQGKEHRYYRQAFVRAMRPQVLAEGEAEMRAVVRESLASLAAEPGPVSTARAITAFRDMTTRMLVRLLLGIDAFSELNARLVEAYNRFAAGYAPAYGYDVRNLPFAEIRAAVDDQARRLREAPDEGSNDSVLKGLLAHGVLDDTSAGNLIYMVESGRFDLYSLFRWIAVYLAQHRELTARVRGERESPRGVLDGLPMACVLEALRSNQSEAIQRVLLEDVEFEGYFFPAGSQLRICLWEAHKDPGNFPQPFRFDPGRFLDTDYSLSEYAPFGMDQHRCVASDVVVTLGALFVQELSDGYDVEPVSGGEPVWGAYHWEPSPAFSFRLTAAGG